MKKKYSWILLLICSINLFAFTIEGNPESWDKADFLGFDEIGDCSGTMGDISSVFTRIEDNELFFRVTFDGMFSKESEIDYFINQKIQLQLTISDATGELFSEDILIDKLTENNRVYFYVINPENNLFEMRIPWDSQITKEKLFFNLEILHNNELVDQFYSDGSMNHRGGNAAFVHHGNQSLTYTAVFYGEEPQDETGFDEVLEIHQATGVPGNFHVSGTLMSAAEWYHPEFNDWLSAGVQEGWASMLTSAFAQHMMPFVNNDMNDWSVSIEADMVEFIYGYQPRVAWVPERVWLSPGVYPDAGVIDWIGDNWTQHGVNAVILDDWPHCQGSSSTKIHWMNNAHGVELRVIPINSNFVGAMHNDAGSAKNIIQATGQFDLVVYGTDWEFAAEVQQGDDPNMLERYADVVNWCAQNYPAVNIWKLDDAINNADFNGEGVEIQNGTYGLLGGPDGYGGSNNSWYTNWAGTPSESDFHDPQWNYGTVWDDAYGNLMSAPNNGLAQLGWYTMMVNLYETGWHEEGVIAEWEKHHSTHIKNANVYTEASRWANGDYTQTTACFFSDIDHDGGEELVIHNDNVFFVFEGIGGKANWIFYKDGLGNAYSVVGSDVSYFSETNGDYNENSSNNHIAALSDVSPNQQNSIYEITINESQGDLVSATLSQYGVSKTISLETGKNYLDVNYNFFGETGYVKSGWTPDLLDLIWSGKSHLQRLWGDYGSYCGQRNSSSGATVALVLGSAGASHNAEFEGTLVKGDEIYGTGIFNVYLYAGYSSEPYNESLTQVQELDSLAANLLDDVAPQLISATQVSPTVIHLYFSDVLDPNSIENLENYSLDGLSGSTYLDSAYLLYGRRVSLVLSSASEVSTVSVSGLMDLSGNEVDLDFNEVDVGELIVNPHLVGDINNWDTSNHDYDFVLNNNGVWELTLDLPAGEFQYKVLESDEWDENDWPGVNQTIFMESAGEVTLVANCGFYTGARNWDEFVSHLSPTIVGNFMDDLDIGLDWDPTNSNGSMVEDNGLYTWEALIPMGEWEFKVVMNSNWDQDTFGNGGNFNFTSDGIVPTVFNYDFRQNSTYYSSSTGCLLEGDVNYDGNIDVLDIVVMVGFVLGGSGDVSCGDLNADGTVNVLDIVNAVSIILEN